MARPRKISPLRFGVILRHPKYSDVIWMVVAPHADPVFPFLAVKIACRSDSFTRPGSHEVGKVWRIPQKGWVIVDE